MSDGYYDHEVTMCTNCPLSFVDFERELRCKEERGRSVKRDEDPPDWCPLRRGPISIRLDRL